MSELEDEIEILKGEIRKRDKIIDDLRLELAECRGRVKELRSENRSLQDEVNRLTVLKLDLKLRDVQRLEDENNRLEHRIEITKGLLDEARERLDVLERVVEEFRCQSFADRVRGRKPESLIYYDERFRK